MIMTREELKQARCCDENEMIDDWGEKEIDWEQRRYEIAKDALIGIIAAESIPGVDPFHYIDKDVSRAIEYADELIKHLKSK